MQVIGCPNYNLAMKILLPPVYFFKVKLGLCEWDVGRGSFMIGIIKKSNLIFDYLNYGLG